MARIVPQFANGDVLDLAACATGGHGVEDLRKNEAVDDVTADLDLLDERPAGQRGFLRGVHDLPPAILDKYATILEDRPELGNRRNTKLVKQRPTCDGQRMNSMKRAFNDPHCAIGACLLTVPLSAGVVVVQNLRRAKISFCAIKRRPAKPVHTDANRCRGYSHGWPGDYRLGRGRRRGRSAGAAQLHSLLHRATATGRMALAAGRRRQNRHRRAGARRLQLAAGASATAAEGARRLWVIPWRVLVDTADGARGPYGKGEAAAVGRRLGHFRAPLPRAIRGRFDWDLEVEPGHSFL